MNPANKSSAGFTRRHFLSAAALGAVAAPQLVSGADKKASISADGKLFNEPATTLPLVSDVDVIVCGAGPAGVSAAITAARAGAKVRLFEWRGCLGGVWTAGLLGYLLDFDKPGFARELLIKLDERGVRRGTSMKSVCYEPEGMKLLLEELCVEAGVKFQLHTRVAAAYREGRRLTTIVTESLPPCVRMRYWAPALKSYVALIEPERSSVTLPPDVAGYVTVTVSAAEPPCR